MDILEINLSSLDEFKESELLNNVSYNIKHNDLNFCFYLKRFSKSDKLIVLGQGAVDRKSKSLPNYQRISWLDELECNCIIIQDPTLFLYDNLPLGWCQGNKKQSAIPGFIDIIKYLTTSLNIKYSNLCFYGSSAGGFSSLIFSPFFEESIVIVNNPQTNFLKYHQANVRALLRECFENITCEEYEEKHTYYSAENVISKRKYIPKVFYYQNIADGFHLREHLIPFLKGIKNIDLMESLHKINIFLYDDPKTGHNPLSKKQTINILEHHFINKNKYRNFDTIPNSSDDNDISLDNIDISTSIIISDKQNEDASIRGILKAGLTCKEKIVIFRYGNPSDESLKVLKENGVKSISIPNKTHGFCLNFLIKKAKNKNIVLLNEVIAYRTNYYVEAYTSCCKESIHQKTCIFVNYCSFSNCNEQKISSVIIVNKDLVSFPSDNSELRNLLEKIDENIDVYERTDLFSSVFEDYEYKDNIYYHGAPLRAGSVEIQELKEIFL
ncbi:hypothetical protein [Aeromonas veronii]|uniref:hypothetical protein n=1 Tax=Aeromonas veronii TaxID=654 RepID=UPI001D0AED4F|nr:hypothetical protein [Aeromonas veronii]UDN24413.1 hypothetical protein LEO77_07835 [Aeromonas veronii]